jgi:arylsulfatase A-like enzyme
MSTHAPAPRRPNVVVVLADDLGWGDVSCYGADRIHTPHIDRLAAEGIRFLDAHASSAVCTPSRYGLLTGRYCWRSPLKAGVLMGHAPALIEPGRPTLGSVFQAAGYRTAAIGKWHLGLGWRQRDGNTWSAFRAGDPLALENVGIDPDDCPTDRSRDFGETIDYTEPFSGGPLALGFDRFFGIAGSLDMPPYTFLSQDSTVGVPRREKSTFLAEQRPGLQGDDWDEGQVDLAFTREAVQFIRGAAHGTAPFLLYFAPSAPHRPQVPPPFLAGVSQAGPRGDAVAFVDWMTGQLVEELVRNGVYDDTIFVFTSDNGAPTLFDDVDIDVHRPNGPWRGQKGDIWDGGHREPLVVRWPGHVPTGAVRDIQIGLVDLVPTLAALAGVTLPDQASPDGIDLSAAMLGAPVAPSHPLVHHSVGGAFSLRTGPWKAIFASGSGVGFSHPRGRILDKTFTAGQLYDVVCDPQETVNRWHERPDVVVRLYAMLKELVGSPDSGLDFDLPLES